MPKRRWGSSDGELVVFKNPNGVLFKDLVLVGRGKVTNNKCGRFQGFYGCTRNKKHKGDVAYVIKYFNSCDRPSCPICYRLGWAVRQARANEARLVEASKVLGLPIEHVMCSLPRSDYDLPLKEARRKDIEVLLGRDVIGGLMILHGQRIDKETGVESFSPHWHVLGFIRGGYHCRECDHKWNCTAGCGGWDARIMSCS